MGMEPPSSPATTPNEYPARLEIDYPDRQLDRVSSFFRIFWVIPIAFVLELLQGSYIRHHPLQRLDHDDRGDHLRGNPVPAGGADAALPPEVPRLVV